MKRFYAAIKLYCKGLLAIYFFDLLYPHKNERS